MEIRREIFGSDNLDTVSVNDLVGVGLIEGKEMARDAISGATSGHPVVNAVLQFQQHKKGDSTKPPLNCGRKDKCPKCKQTSNVFKMMLNCRYSKHPYTECYECWKKLHQPVSKDEHITDTSAVSFDLAVVSQ